MAGLLAFAGPIAFFTGSLSVMRAPTPDAVGRLGLWWFAYGLVLWCLMLVTGYACEQWIRPLRQPLRAVAWLLAACTSAAFVNIVTAGRTAILIEQGVVHSAGTALLYAFTFTLVITLLYFAYLRRSREHEQAATRLAVAQMAQRDARRRIVQARLQELQARIDPQLLFEMLDTARRLYESDAAQGERFLDELIVFLRAALPRLRTASSSLLREIELARAYVGLNALAGATGLAVTIDIAPDAMHARFPPGALLPLLDTAITAGARRITLLARRIGEDCIVSITMDAAPSDAAVKRVRSLLGELYGISGKLEMECATAGINVIVTLPYEHT